MDENEKLIQEVEKYRHLYDHSHQDYKDVIMKGNSWNTISETIGLFLSPCGRLVD